METHGPGIGRKYHMRIVLAMLVALVAADGVISRFIIGHGLASEGNPLLQRWIGEDGFLLVKIAGAFVAALVLWDIYRRHPRLSFIVSLTAMIVYTGIVFWSLLIYAVMFGRV